MSRRPPPVPPMAPGPADQRSVRRHNLGLVLRNVADMGPRSRARIATSTGLNKTTVSSLVAELVERGLLRETETENPGAVGRPAVKVELNGEGIVALGLEVNVDFFAICVTDLAGRVRCAQTVPHDNRAGSPRTVLGELGTHVEAVLAELDALDLVPVGATLALPGLVDSARGVLFVAPNLGWERTDAAALLHERLGQPAFAVRVDNDANLGALAERWYGVGRTLRDFVYVKADVGVGAGIVVGGELFRGAGGFSGEFGHLTVDPQGRRCGCGGRGCLETIVGLEALLRLAALEVGDRSTAEARRLVARLVEKARAGDRSTLGALDEVGHGLGVGLSSLANVLNPAAVVLGGYLGPLSEWLAGPVRAEMAERVLASRFSPVGVLASGLGQDAAVRGAAALSLREVLDDPGAVHGVWDARAVL